MNVRRMRPIPRLHAGRARDESGVALVVALIVTLFVVVVGATFLALGDYEVRLVGSEKEAAQAFWLAEAGRHHAVMTLNRDYGSVAPSVDIAHFVQGSPSDGTYDVSLTLQAGGTRLVLVSTGTTMGGTVRAVQTVFDVESFARYAYFSDAEQTPGGSPIWFYTGDRLEGPVHTNGQIHIAGTPRFDDLVTSRWPTFRFFNGGNPYDSNQSSSPTDHPDFRGSPAPGYQLNVEEIPIPFTTANLRQAAQSGGLALTGDYEVILARSNAYGTVSYRRTGTSGWTDAALPGNGVLHVQGSVTLQGVLDGLLTIGCSGSISLTDNLVYRDSDVSGVPVPGCTDYMGLVAERNIVVADNAPNAADIRLNGVLMAMDTSFTVQNYNQGAYRGILTLWGGVIQKYRGPVGTWNPRTGSRTGYQKDYHFDQRMQTRTPPGFPLSYRRTSWAPV